MNLPASELIKDAVTQGRWEAAANVLRSLGASRAAEAFLELSDEQQEMLFRQLPVADAAALIAHFPYYQQYVLLHSRPRELRAIVDAMNPDDRMRLFDELPEEAWRRLHGRTRG